MDLYFDNKRQTSPNTSYNTTYNTSYNPSNHSNTVIIKDHYYLIYGVKVSTDLYYTMIDYIIESGEWEG